MSFFDRQRINKAYLGDITATNIIRVLPTRWRRKPAGIDTERNYVTVTLCIAIRFRNNPRAIIPLAVAYSLHRSLFWVIPVNENTAFVAATDWTDSEIGVTLLRGNKLLIGMHRLRCAAILWVFLISKCIWSEMSPIWTQQVAYLVTQMTLWINCSFV